MASRKSMAGPLVAVGTYLNAFSQWYLVWLFARVSGAETAGLYASLFAYATPVFALAHFGLREHYLTSLQRYPWSIYVYLRYAGIALGVTAMAVVVWAAQLPLAMSIAVVAMKASNAVLDLYNGKIQRAQAFTALGLISISNALISTIMATIAAGVFGSAVTAVLLSGVVSLICGVAAWWKGTHVIDRTPKTLSRPVRSVVQDATPITVSLLASSLSASLPVMVVERAGSAHDVGVFAGAAYLLTIANLTGAAVRQIQLPYLANIYESVGWKAVHTRVARTAVLYLAIGVLGGCIATALGPEVLAILYGAEFRMERFPIGLLALTAALTIPGFLLTAELLITNAYRTQSLIGIASVIGAIGYAAILGWHSNIAPVAIGASTALVGRALHVALTIVALRGERSA